MLISLRLVEMGIVGASMYRPVPSALATVMKERSWREREASAGFLPPELIYGRELSGGHPYDPYISLVSSSFPTLKLQSRKANSSDLNLCCYGRRSATVGQ